MGLANAWSAVKRALGWGGQEADEKPSRDQRMALPQADRWSRMLKALQVAPGALLPALERELAKGIGGEERQILPPKEGAFFDGLVIRRKAEALDLFCSALDPLAVSERIMGKVPSLRDWATGALGDSALLRSTNPEMVAWAREKGKFRQGALRESLLAEAIEGGRMEVAKRELGDAGLDKLDAAQMQSFMGAFAQRKEAGLSAGLDAQALDAFAQALGGWAELGEQAAGLSPEKLLDLISDLLDAIEEEKLMETKVFERARAVSSKRVREMLAKAVAAQAAKSDRPMALRSALTEISSATGSSVERAAKAKAQSARVRVGAMEVLTKVEDGVTLYEVARLSGSIKAAREIERIAPGAAKLDPARMEALVARVESGVRSLVMRSSGEARESTKAWRGVVKQWKEGVLGDAKLGDMQKIVREKVESTQGSAQDGADPRRPKGP